MTLLELVKLRIKELEEEIQKPLLLSSSYKSAFKALELNRRLLQRFEERQEKLKKRSRFLKYKLH